MTTKDSAKIVRAALKKAFPDTKFSVRSDMYAGGSSINVDWIDGPTDEQVDKIVGDMEGATFDGMQDLKEYRDNEFGNDFLFTNRHYSVKDGGLIYSKVDLRTDKPTFADMIDAASKYLWRHGFLKSYFVKTDNSIGEYEVTRYTSDFKIVIDLFATLGYNVNLNPTNTVATIINKGN